MSPNSIGEPGPFCDPSPFKHLVSCAEADTDAGSLRRVSVHLLFPNHSGGKNCDPSSINQMLTNAQLLLRLEKYPHRMNFHQGILESRKQYYKHLKKKLVNFTSVDVCWKLTSGFRRQ